MREIKGRLANEKQQKKGKNTKSVKDEGDSPENNTLNKGRNT